MKNERRLMRVARCEYLLSLLTRLLSKWLKTLIVMIEENVNLKLLRHCHILFAPSRMRMDQRLRVTNLRHKG